MAEGLLREMLPDRLVSQVEVISAGTHAVEGDSAQTNAILAMATMGVDISRHRSQLLHRNMISDADLILVMEREHISLLRRISFLGSLNQRLLAKFHPDKNLNLREIADPFGLGYEAYLECADLLQECVLGVVQHLEKKIT
jgi:protein-tyrosine phosphatase